MSPFDIQLRFKELELDSIFSNSKNITGIKQQRYLEVIDGITKSSKLSKTLFRMSKPSEPSPKLVAATVGEWVLVEYNGEFYPGEVKGIEKFEYLVSVMIRAGKHWKWPQNVDEIYYSQEKVIRKHSAPDVVNAQGHFSFCEI